MTQSASASAFVAAAAAGGREFPYTDGDFRRACALIRERAGIALSDSKRDMVYSRLSRRLRELGLSSIREYLDRVEADPAGESEAFTNALTTNLTSFFREPHHFDALRRQLAKLPRGQTVNIWCAAASTGEEPYSLAMTLFEHYDGKPPARLVCTDVDTNVLAHGERGVYALERVAKMPKARLQRFFRRGTGAHEGYCRVVDELREFIEFRPLNLLDARYPIQGPLDALFCRNVMIYFDKPTQYGILKRFVPLLRPEGLLYAGHSESFLHAADLFVPCGRTIYRRAA